MTEPCGGKVAGEGVELPIIPHIAERVAITSIPLKFITAYPRQSILHTQL